MPRKRTTKIQALDEKMCDQLALALVRVLKDGEPIAPSETIELVDAVIEYIRAVDDHCGSATAALDELADARADYSGPGIIPR